jgi:hypothetical protein
MPDTMMVASAAPVRDLCPALRNIRLRLRRCLALVEKQILTAAPEALRDARLGGLAREREELLGALQRVATASQRGLAPGDRLRELETLLEHLPGCVTRKARARVLLLIDGLRCGA